MSTIDNRIVDMRFEHDQFEAGIKSSVAALDNFSQELTEFAGSGASLDALSSSVDQVSGKFTILGDLGWQAIQRINAAIIDKIVNLKEMISQYTGFLSSSHGMADGFSMYERMIDTTRTLVNATGYTAEEVDRKLQPLVKYTDKTVYDFNEMANAVTRFVNAGRDMDQSVVAVKGITNLAALSGVSIEQASRAMDTFNSAIGKGSMTLNEWSRVNRAQMGTMEFKNLLVDAALAAGTLVETMIDGEAVYKTLTTDNKGKSADFRQDLSDWDQALRAQWITAEVMMAVLRDLGDENTVVGAKAYGAAAEIKTFTALMNDLNQASASGWMETFKLVIGDLDEASEMFSAASDTFIAIIEHFSEVRNTMFGDWKELGGRSELLQGIVDIWKTMVDIFHVFNDVYRDFFPRRTGEQLYNQTKMFANFAAQLRPSEQTLDQLRRIFIGLFSIIEIGKTSFSFMVGLVKEFFGLFSSKEAKVDDGQSTLSKILEFFASIGDYLASVSEAMKASDALINTIQAMQNAWARMSDFFDTHGIIKGIIYGIGLGLLQASKFVVTSIIELGRLIIDTFKRLLGIASPSRVFMEFGTNIIQGLTVGIRTGYNTVLNTLTSLLDIIRNTMQSFADNLNDLNWSPFDGLINKLKELAGEGTVLYNVVRIFEGFMVQINRVWSWMKSTFGPMISFLIDSLRSLTIGDVGALLTGTGVAFGGLGFYNLIQNLKGSFSGISTIMNSFSNVIEGFTGVGKALSGVLDGVADAMSGFKTKMKAEALETVAYSILVLTIALIALSFLEWEAIGKGVAGITALVANLVGAMVGLEYLTTGFTKGGGAGKLVAIGVAILFMALALRSISNLGDSVVGSLVVIGALVAMITLFSKYAGGPEVTIGSMQLIAIGISIRLLSSALAVISKIHFWTLVKGLGGLFILLWGIGSGLNSFFPVAQNMIKLTGGLLILAIALNLLLIPITLFALIPFTFLANGIGKIALLFVALGAALTAFTLIGPHMIKVGVGITLLSIALTLLLIPILALGFIPFEVLQQGIVGIGGALMVIGAALTVLFRYVTGLIPTAIGLTILAVALTGLLVPLIIMGMLPWEVLIQGIAGLGLVLFSLSIGLGIMSLFAGKLIPLAAGLTLLSIALTLMIIPIVAMGLVPWSVLEQGLVSLAGALGIIALFIGLISLIKPGIPIIAGQLIALSGAVFLMALSLTAIGLIPLEVIGRGLLAVFGSLLAIFIAMKIAPSKAVFMGAALGLIAMAGALALMTVPLILLSNIDIWNLGKALGALAIVAAILIGSLFLLGMAAKPLALFGASLLLVAGSTYVLVTALEKFVNIIGRVGGWIGSLLEYFGIKAPAAYAGGGLAEVVDKETSQMLEAAQDNLDPEEYRQTSLEAMIALGQGVGDADDVIRQIADETSSIIPNSINNAIDPDSLQHLGQSIPQNLGNGMVAGQVNLEKLMNDFDISSLMSGNINPSQMNDLMREFTGGQSGGGGGLLNGQMDLEKLMSGGNFDISSLMSGNIDPSQMNDLMKEFTSGETGGGGGILDGNEQLQALAKRSGIDLNSAFASELDPRQMNSTMRDYFSGAKDVMGEVGIEFPSQMTGIGRDVVSAAEETMSQDAFKPVGGNIVDGMIQGIESGKPKLMNTIQQLANEAAQAARQALDSHSPSMVFAAIGHDVSEGLAIGIRQNVTSVIQATQHVGDSAVDSMAKSLSHIGDSDWLDVNPPTITPVLDLSQVEQQANLIPGMIKKATASAKTNTVQIGDAILSKDAVLAQPVEKPVAPIQKPITMTNTFNVRNENDARQISNKLGTLLNRHAYARGVV